MFSLDKVSQKFNQQWIFKNLSQQFPDKEILTLLGPSGCGKSTLLRQLAGLIPVYSGTITSSRIIKPGFVFQDSRLLSWLTVRENIGLGITNSSLPKHARHEQIQNVIDLVELTTHENKYPHELSGGMKMRVSIARALVEERTVIFMDEPFAALDDQIRFELQDQVVKLWAVKQISIFFVTHSLTEATFLSHKILIFPDKYNLNFEFKKIKNTDQIWSRNSQDYFQCLGQLTERMRGSK